MELYYNLDGRNPSEEELKEHLAVRERNIREEYEKNSSDEDLKKVNLKN